MNNTLNEEDIQYVDASQPAPAVKPAAPDDIKSATATNVDMVQDPYKSFGNGFLHSTETEPYLDDKGKVKHRNFWKEPATKEELEEYKKTQDSGGKLGDKALKDEFERYIKNGETIKAGTYFYNDAMNELDRMQKANGGGVIDTEAYIQRIKNSPEYQMLKDVPYGPLNSLLLDIRNKGNQMNKDIQEQGTSKAEQNHKEQMNAIASSSKATQAKVDTSAKATQDKVEQSAQDIKDFIGQKYEESRTAQDALYATYADNPKLKGYNKDSDLNDARKATKSAKDQVAKQAAEKDDKKYLQALQAYQLATQKENMLASNTLKSEDYLQAAAEGMNNSNKITKAAKQDTEKWLPKSIIQAYLDGEFGQKTFVQEKDANGKPRFDAEGNPIYKQKKIKKLDENGKQIFITKPVLDKNGNPLLDKEGNPRTYQEPQWEMANAEGYPSRAKQALGYYLLDTIGNMLTGATAYFPNSRTTDTPSAWQKMQRDKAESYQNAINTANANAVTGSADTARGYSEDQRATFKKLTDEGFNLSALMARKQLDSSQIYELTSLANAGQYMKTMDSKVKQALMDGMLMTADNIDEATAAILKSEWNKGPSGALQQLYKSVTTAGDAALKGAANGLTRLLGFIGVKP